MFQLLLSLSKVLPILILATACSLPRGAPQQSEILSKSKSPHYELSVYPVTKSLLAAMDDWPISAASAKGPWVGHQHTGSTPLIAPGDQVNLTVWDSEENSLLTSADQKVIKINDILVSPNGMIFVPYLDEIKIAGLSDEAARGKIQSQMEAIIPSAQVQLTIAAGAKRSVSLVGGVADPGVYPIVDTHSTVLNLISQGGGVSPALRNPQVRLVRAGRTYQSSLRVIYANPEMDSVLRGGDKVIVENDPRYFRSLGAASKEQLVQFEEDSISALDAISLIGGISDRRADPQGILVLREYTKNQVRYDGTGPDNTRVVFVIDLTTPDGLFSAGQFAINTKDTVLVTESPLTTVNTVLSVFRDSFRTVDIVQ